MPTRYQQLRQAVANLAIPAEAQARYLDESFTSVTGGGCAAEHGNDELALELDGMFQAANDMIEHGELSEGERMAILPLDEWLTGWSGPGKADFWQRDALFNDARWEEVRACAAHALAGLPAEERAVGRSA